MEIGAGSTANTIGGTVVGSANVISGNTTFGVQITGVGSTENTIVGNLIGTDITGTMAIANGTGVAIDSGASGNTIGGLTSTPGTGLGNLISGNINDGVEITGSGTTGDVVLGNLIGMNAADNVVLPNGTGGVEIDTGASENTIGGTIAGSANVISGNSNAGLWLTGSGTNDNVAAGDFFGINAAGTGLVGNANGVLIDAGASSNTIGGTTAAARDVIDDSGNGVSITDAATADNVVEGDYIGLKPNGSTGASNIYGIYITYAAQTTVGGTTAGAKTSSREMSTTASYSAHADTTVLEGNFIGTDPTGMLAEGNQQAGVFLYYGVGTGGTKATVGGLTPAPGTGAGNVISGNGGENI